MSCRNQFKKSEELEIEIKKILKDWGIRYEISLLFDETGDHGLTYIDKNFPLFVLCGCLFRDEALKKVEEKIDALKLKFFKSKDVVLHSREIRKCEGGISGFI